MAEAMKLAVRAGRLAYLAGRIPAQAVRDGEQPGRRTGRALIACRKAPTISRALKAERAAADRAVQRRADATRSRAPAAARESSRIRRRDPDEHQLTSLNTLWKIAPSQPQPAAARFEAASPLPSAASSRRCSSSSRRSTARSSITSTATCRFSARARASIDGGLTVLRDTTRRAARFRASSSSCSRSRRMWTRAIATSRDCCAACRGRSTPCRRSDEAVGRPLARDRHHDRRLSEMETELQDLRKRVAELQERLG